MFAQIYMERYSYLMEEDGGSGFWRNANYHVGVSWNGGTPKTPQNDHFLVGKPMVVGYQHFRKPPCIPYVQKIRPVKSGFKLPMLRTHQQYHWNTKVTLLRRWLFWHGEKRDPNSKVFQWPPMIGKKKRHGLNHLPLNCFDFGSFGSPTVDCSEIRGENHLRYWDLSYLLLSGRDLRVRTSLVITIVRESCVWCSWKQLKLLA